MNTKVAPVLALYILTAPFALPVVFAPVVVRAAPVSDDDATAARRQKRGVITVVSVNALGKDGRFNVTKLGDKGDAVMFSKAEEAVTQSRAYRLVGRDQWEDRAKEIKFNEEGFVDEASAKKFGGDVGVDKLMVVFVSGATQRNYNAIVDYETEETAPFTECTVTIICRYTDVQSSDRQTVSYTGTYAARKDQNPLESIAEMALGGAFEELRKDLWRKRQPFIGKVVQVKDNFIRIDLGTQDGIVPGVEFEMYAISDDGEGFVDRKRLCGEKIIGRVIEVNDTNAKIELGEMKDKKILGVSTGKEWKVDAKHIKTILDFRATEAGKTAVIEAVEKR